MRKTRIMYIEILTGPDYECHGGGARGAHPGAHVCKGPIVLSA